MRLLRSARNDKSKMIYLPRLLCRGGSRTAPTIFPLPGRSVRTGRTGRILFALKTAPVYRLTQMKNLEYEVVNVFTNNGKNGNALAVFCDARSLKKSVMQTIAKKLGFSETSFVVPKTKKSADYRVRFFTPAAELRFAGHPSLGTLFVLRRLGLLKKKKSYVQQIGGRLLEMSILKDGRIVMDQGKPIFGKTLPPKMCASLLGVAVDKITGQPMTVSTGNRHLLVPLRDIKTLESASINMRVYRKVAADSSAQCIMPFTVRGGSVTCRMFAPGIGVPEDPATGSGCGPLAAYLARYQLVSFPNGKTSMEIKVKQGTKKSGYSLLYAWVEKDGDKITRVLVGAHCMG